MTTVYKGLFMDCAYDKSWLLSSEFSDGEEWGAGYRGGERALALAPNLHNLATPMVPRIGLP